VKPGVHITFDVECSMGGAWGDPALKPVPPSRAMMGQYDHHEYGLPRIVDILDASRLAATFFVEAFTDEQGYPGETQRVCRYLLDRGQDVQLHVHPNHWHYGLYAKGLPHPCEDAIAALPPEKQRELLAEGAARLARWTGRPPVAFRAGNMAASEATLEQLAAVGIRIDSSYTFPFAGGKCRFSAAAPYNGSRWYGDVLELALSGFRQPPVPGLKAAKPLDLMGVSFAECREAIKRICGAGADAVLILHSFSLMKVRNVQYDGGRPNRIVTRRFERLCRWLAEHREAYPVRSFAQVAEAVAQGEYAARTAPPPRLSATRAVVRKLVQAYNGLYWT